MTDTIIELAIGVMLFVMMYRWLRGAWPWEFKNKP
jgi:hypothetical protein